MNPLVLKELIWRNIFDGKMSIRRLPTTPHEIFAFYGNSFSISNYHFEVSKVTHFQFRSYYRSIIDPGDNFWRNSQALMYWYTCLCRPGGNLSINFSVQDQPLTYEVARYSRYPRHFCWYIYFMKINTRYYIYLSEWKFFWENGDNDHHNREIEFVN